MDDILDTNYWRQRLLDAPKGNLHHAIFKCPLDKWMRIERRHRALLERYIQDNEDVLDIGCGWGRLLELMPGGWYGTYLGIDLSPDFIEKARANRYDRDFVVCDMTNPFPFILSNIKNQVESYSDRRKGAPCFDWAVMVSMRPMIRRFLGQDTWEVVAGNVLRLAKKILILEYDETDKGEIVYRDGFNS